MKHNQNWTSGEEKLKAWLELSHLSFHLKLEGLKQRMGEKIAEEELYRELDRKREEQRSFNHKILPAIL